MLKVINFINPSVELEKNITIQCCLTESPYKYLISESPFISADILIIPFDELNSLRDRIELNIIPFIPYGPVEVIEDAFILGASDFLKEPWTFLELEIRSKRLISSDMIRCEWGIIKFSNEFIRSDQISLPLSISEYKILSTLANNRNKIISRENLHYRLDIQNNDSRILDVYINSLRKKIIQISPEDNSGDSLIKTIRGKGYTINSQ